MVTRGPAIACINLLSRGWLTTLSSLPGRRRFYYPYLEPEQGGGKGLLKELAGRACVVVSDDFPAFFLPRMIDAAAAQVPVRFELVDSNGLLPMRAAEKVFARAFDFRRFLQKNLLPHLADVPQRKPLSRLKLPTLEALPRKITQRWPMAEPARLLASGAGFGSFPIDHSVEPCVTAGGSRGAEQDTEPVSQDETPDLRIRA